MTRGDLITVAAGVVKFLQRYFDHIGNKEVAGYFATWSPYRILRVHVKLNGPNEIYRPQPELKGIKGTRDAYVFIDAKTVRPDASSTTWLRRNPNVPDNRNNDGLLAIAVDEGAVKRTGLTVKKPKKYVAWSSA